MSDDLRQRILDAAQELFVESGANGVSMRKVAEMAGVSAPAIYRQRRCGPLRRGYGGEVETDEFTVYKFRTMRQDAEANSAADEQVLIVDPAIQAAGFFRRQYGELDS